MPEIKTRDVVKGTVKTFDRAAVAGERMKQAYVRTKDKAEQGAYSAESAPEEYAADRVSGGAETAAHEVVYQLDRHGRKAVKTTRDNISTVRESMEQRKANQPKRAAQKQAEQQTVRRAGAKTADAVPGPSSVSQSPAPTGSSDLVMSSIRMPHRELAAIKTTGQGKRTIKQTARFTGKAAAIPTLRSAPR